jgi:hypothetical protein
VQLWSWIPPAFIPRTADTLNSSGNRVFEVPLSEYSNLGNVMISGPFHCRPGPFLYFGMVEL